MDGRWSVAPIALRVPCQSDTHNGSGVAYGRRLRLPHPAVSRRSTARGSRLPSVAAPLGRRSPVGGPASLDLPLPARPLEVSLHSTARSPLAKFEASLRSRLASLTVHAFGAAPSGHGSRRSAARVAPPGSRLRRLLTAAFGRRSHGSRDLRSLATRSFRGLPAVGLAPTVAAIRQRPRVEDDGGPPARRRRRGRRKRPRAVCVVSRGQVLMVAEGGVRLVERHRNLRPGFLGAGRRRGPRSCTADKEAGPE